MRGRLANARARALSEQEKVAHSFRRDETHLASLWLRWSEVEDQDLSVARVRLEDAKTQLLNPSHRISEIAYDVGFQSLTQFNRMFKRVFGQSPTEFREHLGTHNQRVKAA